MLNFRVSKQTLTKQQSSILASETINYITASFAFSSDWNGLSKWAHFEQGGINYPVELHDDKIEATQGLNLSEGAWSVYVHGNAFNGEEVTQRITTNVIKITVKPTGTIEGEVFPPMSPTAEEQTLAKSVNAENVANEALTKVTEIDGHVEDLTNAFDINAINETADFIANANLKTEDFDGNAVEQTNTFNTNAQEKQALVDTKAQEALARKDAEITALGTLTTEQQASVDRLQAENAELEQQQADTDEAVNSILPLVL